jgi:hypothetical protein
MAQDVQLGAQLDLVRQQLIARLEWRLIDEAFF